MDTRRAYDLEAVLEHSSWVRALAERLVRDPGEADDIVQETWIAAERHRPGLEHGLRPWLSGVVRRLALRKRRDRTRLERRERAAARPEAAPASEDIVLRDELRALVGRSLAELDEPFRSTLILRYFAGLEPSEIAAREGVPPATVRTRLRRGLDKLREELDRRHGGRAAWSATFLGLFERIDAAAGPPLAAGPAAVGGGIAMHVGWKLVMAAAAVALTAWVGWEMLDVEGEVAQTRRSAELANEALERPADDERTPDLSLGAAPADPERRSVGANAAAAAESAPAPAAAAAAIVSGRVVDAGNRPIAGASVDRARDEGASGQLTDAEGRFRLELELPDPLRDSFETSLVARQAGFATRSITTILRRSAPTDVGDVVLQRACAVAGRLEDENGRPIAGTALAGPAPLSEADPDRLRRQGPQYDALASHVPTRTVGADGAFAIDDVEPGALRVWGTAEGRGWVSSEPLDLAAGERRAGLVLRLAPLGRSDSIVGHVFAPDGAPVVEARIDACFQTPEYATSIAANTDAQGRFEILVQSNVPHELRVEDRQDRWSPIVAAPVRAGEMDLELRFEEPRAFDIHVKSREGGAVAEFEAHATQAQQVVQGISFGPIEKTKRGERHENGLAKMRLPRVPFELEIVAPGFAEAKLGPLDPERMPPRIEFELEPMPGIEGRVIADAEGVDLTGTKVELHTWMASDGTCTWKNGYRTFYGNYTEVKATTGADGKFRLDLRKSGRIVLLAVPPPELAGRFPTAELGPLELDARVGAKGLEIRMTTGGAIEGRVLVPPGQSAAGRIVAMNHGDAEPFTVRTDEEGRFRAERLAPGNWQVMLATEEVLQSTSRWTSQAEEEAPDESQLWTCRVEVGKTAHVDLDDRHARSGSLTGRLTLEGGSAEGWIATLRDAAAMRPEAVSGSTATLDRDGRFELRFERAGLHRLAISAPGEPGAALVLRAEVELVAGGNEWQRSFPLGRIAGSGLAVEPGEEALFRYAARAQEVEVSCRILPQPGGDFALPIAIAGPGAIERFQPVAGETWSQWKEVTTFVVPAGAEAFVRAP